MGNWKVSDFKTGTDITSPQKVQLYENIVKRSFGSWECAAKKFKLGGVNNLRCQGMSRVLRDLIDPDNLEEETRATYGGQENLSLREMEEKLLKTLAGGKANQFKRNFGILYNMHSGNAPSIFDEKETEDYLNKAFNIDSKPPVKTISTLNIDKSKCYSIKSDIEKLLKSANEEEKRFISNLD